MLSMMMMILILDRQTLKHREVKRLAGVIQLVRDSVRSEGPLVLSIPPYCFEAFPLVTTMNTRSGGLADRSCREVSLHLSLNAGSLPVFSKGKTQVVKKLPLMP